MTRPQAPAAPSVRCNFVAEPGRARGDARHKYLEVKAFYGGRGWDRTSDPYDVNVVLSR